MNQHIIPFCRSCLSWEFLFGAGLSQPLSQPLKLRSITTVLRPYCSRDPRDLSRICRTARTATLRGFDAATNFALDPVVTWPFSCKRRSAVRTVESFKTVLWRESRANLFGPEPAFRVSINGAQTLSAARGSFGLLSITVTSCNRTEYESERIRSAYVTSRTLQHRLHPAESTSARLPHSR
jgi:hypothetical protein